jgi:hypothetical protein
VAQPVYSTRFALVSITDSSSHDLYTVPAGYVAILRDIDGFTSVTPVTSLQLTVTGLTAILIPDPGSSPGPVQWRGRLVMNAGETVACIAPGRTGGLYNLCVSGYLLTVP